MFKLTKDNLYFGRNKSPNIRCVTSFVGKFCEIINRNYQYEPIILYIIIKKE